MKEKGSSCPTFPRVSDTNEQSFVTVIKPAGRLFLQVALWPVNDRPSARGMGDFQVALRTALYSHEWDVRLAGFIFRLQLNLCGFCGYDSIELLVFVSQHLLFSATLTYRCTMSQMNCKLSLTKTTKTRLQVKYRF